LSLRHKLLRQFLSLQSGEADFAADLSMAGFAGNLCRKAVAKDAILRAAARQSETCSGAVMS